VLMPAELVHLCHLFLAFLEATEVILDEERRVELANRDIIISYETRRRQLIRLKVILFNLRNPQVEKHLLK